MEPLAIACAHRHPWNKGNLGGQKALLKLQEIWTLRVRSSRVVGGNSRCLISLSTANCVHVISIAGDRAAAVDATARTA